MVSDKETAGHAIEGEDVVVSIHLICSYIEGWERPNFSLGIDGRTFRRPRIKSTYLVRHLYKILLIDSRNPFN